MSFVVSNLGQVNKTGDNLDALFQTLFAGEVFTAYARTTVMDGLHYVRKVHGQKSASFPMIGNAEVGYHAAAGDELDDGDFEHNERIITLDRPLITSVNVDDWEDMVNHYDVRSRYANAMGEALAVTSDEHVLINSIRTARGVDRDGSTPLSAAGTLKTNEVITNDKLKIGAGGASSNKEAAEAIAFAILDGEVNMKRNDVPKSQRKVAFMAPETLMILHKAATDGNCPWINRDFGGTGVMGGEAPLKIGNTTLFDVNHFPDTNIPKSSTAKEKYWHYFGDFSQTKIIQMTPDAVGTLKLMDIGFEKDRDTRRQCDLLVARTAEGHGSLRTECAQEIALDSLSN